jgi:hypothetical protein
MCHHVVTNMLISIIYKILSLTHYRCQPLFLPYPQNWAAGDLMQAPLVFQLPADAKPERLSVDWSPQPPGRLSR